jgi:hypothetical protein
MPHRRELTSAPARTLSAIEQALVGALALGLVAMLSFPGARAADGAIGWLPFWLVALPASAWLTARGLRRRAATTWAARPLASVHALAVRRASARTASALRRAA